MIKRGASAKTGGGGYSPQQPSHKRRFDDGPDGGGPDAKRQATMAGAPPEASETVYRLLVQAKKVGYQTGVSASSVFTGWGR